MQVYQEIISVGSIIGVIICLVLSITFLVIRSATKDSKNPKLGKAIKIGLDFILGTSLDLRANFNT